MYGLNPAEFAWRAKQYVWEDNTVENFSLSCLENLTNETHCGLTAYM